MLMAGAQACAQEGRQGDTNFLMIAGQIRALTDLAIFMPLDEENTRKAGQLYMAFYYKFGGLGFDEFYRIPANVSALEARIRGAGLAFTPGYDPGWSYRPSSKTDIYSAILSNVREQRIWQMRNAALDLQNDEYYEAQQALNALQRRNPVFKEGTPPYDESRQLTARMREIGDRIPQLPPPADTTPYPRLNEQDPGLAKRQVATGFNGPTSSPQTYIFRSVADVHASWLATALPQQELDALVAKTDFAKQVLIAFSAGERMNASGQILISGLGYRNGSGYTISTRIGVVPDTCGVRNARIPIRSLSASPMPCRTRRLADTTHRTSPTNAARSFPGNQWLDQRQRGNSAATSAPSESCGSEGYLMPSFFSRAATQPMTFLARSGKSPEFGRLWSMQVSKNV